MRPDAHYKLLVSLFLPMDINKNILPVRSGDIPAKVINQIKNAISRHAVGIVTLDSHDNFLAAASGTFVLVHERPALLTARHVIDSVKYNMGLVLTDYFHKFILERFCLEFKSAPKGETESSGPDLGVIYINGPKLGTIKAMKSFFNLNNYANLVRNEVGIPQTGLWAVFGMPAELSDIGQPYQKLAGRVYIAADFNYFERNGYDYFDFDFRSSHPGCVPSSLAGMSGGSIWHARVLIHPSTHKVFVPDDPNWLILSGVSFYQSPVSNGGRNLRAHGRKSIYEKLFEWA